MGTHTSPSASSKHEDDYASTTSGSNATSTPT